jgi:hypothetical protein
MVANPNRLLDKELTALLAQSASLASQVVQAFAQLVLLVSTQQASLQALLALVLRLAEQQALVSPQVLLVEQADLYPQPGCVGYGLAAVALVDGKYCFGHGDLGLDDVALHVDLPLFAQLLHVDRQLFAQLGHVDPLPLLPLRLFHQHDEPLLVVFGVVHVVRVQLGACSRLGRLIHRD